MAKQREEPPSVLRRVQVGRLVQILRDDDVGQSGLGQPQLPGAPESVGRRRVDVDELVARLGVLGDGDGAGVVGLAAAGLDEAAAFGVVPDDGGTAGLGDLYMRRRIGYRIIPKEVSC